MIKTDFWDDEKLTEVSFESRLTFIGLWNFSDDYGVVKGNAKWLKNHLFAYDDSLSNDTFVGWLTELEGKFIYPFKHNGEKFYYIKNFQKHQVINRPSKQRNPEPPDNIFEYSRSTHGGFTDELEIERELEREKELKEYEAFSLPSNEQINESSILKINSDIEIICQKLYEEKIFPKVHAFKNQMLKKNQNERAVLHALSRCYIKKKFDKKGAWGYCLNIMKVENGNYNEREHQKTA